MARMRSFGCPVTTAERPGDYTGTSVACKVPYSHIIYKAVPRHRINEELVFCPCHNYRSCEVSGRVNTARTAASQLSLA